MSGNSSTGRVGQFELAGADLRMRAFVVRIEADFVVRVLSRRICVSWLIGRMAAPARFTFTPRSLVANADFRVERDERELVVLGDGLHTAENRLGGASRDGGGDQAGTPSANHPAGT